MLSKVKLFIYDYYKKNKTLPSFSTIGQFFGFKKHEVINVINDLLKDGFLEKTMEGKYIVKKKLNLTAISKVKIPIQNSENILMRLAMLLISISAMYISIYYSHFYLINFLSKYKSFLLAFTLVGYGVFSFRIGINLWVKKDIFVACAIFFTAAIVLLFSMLSTVAGQYSVQSNKINSRNIVHNEINVNQDKLLLLKAEEKSFQEQIVIQQNDIKINQEKVSEYSTDGIEQDKKKLQVYRNHIWRATLAKRERKKLEVSLAGKRSEILDLINSKRTKIIERANFYTWVSKILPIKANSFEFWLYMFPAIFVDIIAPLGIIVAFRKDIAK